MSGLQITTINERADFQYEEFDKIIYQKGRDVIHEQALQCPCKSKATNQQSNCKNCGGTGWIYINPTYTRFVLSGIDAVTKYIGWSEELRGVVNISTPSRFNLSFMDRITDVNAESIHSEVVFCKQSQGSTIALSTYPIKTILYIGLFVSTSEPLRQLESDQYTIQGNVITLSSSILPPIVKDISITIRYKHAPVFHVLELKRDAMQSFRMTLNGVEENQQLPLSGYGRRAHYVAGAMTAEQLLDNSQPTTGCSEPSLPAQSNEVSYITRLVTGPAGSSAYDIAVANGFQGTQDEWLASIMGDATVYTFTAAENISSGAPVIVEDNLVYKFNSSIIQHAGRLYGFATTAATVGTSIAIRSSGIMTDSGYSFVVDQPLYAGEEEVTQTPPTQGISQLIGVVIDHNSFRINISSPIILL